MTKANTAITLRVTQTAADKKVPEQLLHIAGGKTNAFSVIKGQKYELSVLEGGVPQSAAVVAKKSGQHLILKLADGTEVVAKNFYSECGVDACSMSLTVAGGDPVLLAAEDVAGSTLSDGSQLMYAHGDATALKNIAQGDEALLSNLANVANQGVVTYWPQADAASSSGWTKVAGGLGLLGLAAGGGGGASGGTSEPITNLDIKLVAGPVISGHGLVVTVYDTQGKSIGSGTAGPDGSVRIAINGNYVGVVLVRVSDGNQGPDYVDEASGKPADLTTDLRAILAVNQGGTYTVNVNPLTELAVRGLGLSGGDSGSSVTSSEGVTAEQVKQANERVATSVGLAQELVTGTPPVAIVDTSGDINPAANTYGKLLAALSGADQNTGSTDATLNALVDALEVSDASPEVSVLLINGAKALEQPGIASDVVKGLDSSTTQSPYANAYANILAGADGVSGNNSFTSPPVLADYHALGITDIHQADVALLNNVIDAKASTAADSLKKLEVLGGTTHKIINWLAGETTPDFTAQELTNLGLTGVTELNLSLKLERIYDALAGQTVSKLNQLNEAANKPHTLSLDSTSDISVNGGITRQNTVTVEALEAGANLEFSLDGGSRWATGVGTSFVVPEGRYAADAVQMRQMDAKGQSSTPIKLAAITVDLTAPEVLTALLGNDVGSNNSDRISNNGDVMVSGLETGAKWAYSTDGGDTWAAGTGATFTLAAGTYAADAVQVRQTDVAGNTSAVTKLAAITVDATAPDALTAALSSDTGSSTDRLTINGEVTVSGLETGAQWAYSTDAGSKWTAGTDTTFTLAAGTYAADAVQVRQTDAAGNTSAVTKLAAFTVDTTAPDALTAALSNDTGNGTSGGVSNTGEVAVSGLETGAQWAYSTDGGSNWTAGTGSTFTLTSGNYAANTVQVRQTDVAGNTSAATKLAAITVDTTPPNPLQVALSNDTGSSNSDRISTNGQVAVSGLEAGATWQYTTDGGTSWTHGNGNGFVLAVGNYAADAVQVQQTDVTGTVLNERKMGAIVVDVTAPNAPSVALSADTGSSNTDKITNQGALTVDAEPGAVVEYRIGRQPWSTKQPSLVNGNNWISVRQTDVAGNISASTTFTFYLDTVPDLYMLVLDKDTGISSTDNITNLPAYKVLGNAPGTAVEYSLNNSDWSSTAPITQVGKNTIWLRTIDAAGNVNTPWELTFTYDPDAPAQPTLSLADDSGQTSSNTDGITRKPTVNVAGIEEGAAWAYQVDGAGEWIGGVGTSFDAADGKHSYVVRQTDKAGNSTSSTALDITLMTEASPVTVQMVDSTNQIVENNATNDLNAVMKVTASSGDLVQYRFVDASNADAAWVDLTGSATIAFGEGLHTIETRKVDVAGNYLLNVTRISKDTVAATPVMILADDTGTVGDGVTTNPVVIVSGYEGGATWEVKVDDSPYWNPSSEGPNKFLLEVGTHTYYIRQIDKAGNVSDIGEYTFTYQSELTQPILTLAQDTGVSAGDGITSNKLINVSGLLDGATWQYKIAEGAWVDGTGSSIEMLTDGAAHHYSVRQQLAGKYSAPTTLYNATFDSTAPSALVVSLAEDTGSSSSDGITNNNALTVSGLEVGGRLEYRLDGGEWQGFDNTSTSTTLALDNGTHTYSLRQIDKAGNASGLVERTYTFIPSTLAAPALTLAVDTSVEGDRVTSNGQIDVTLSVSGSGVSWQYQVNNGNWQAGTGTSIAATPGTNSYRVRQIDVAGNTSPASELLTVTYDAVAPTVGSTAAFKFADPDSEGSQTIGTDHVLYTTTATDSTAVTFAMEPSDTLAFDSATGKITFKQPTGYSMGGNNTYSATLTATDAAGNVTTRNLTFEVTRTNLGAPSIELGEFKSGLTEAGMRNGVTLFADGTYGFGEQKYNASTNAWLIMPVHKSAQGDVLNNFAIPDDAFAVLSWATDAQDRVYLVTAVDRAPLNTQTYNYWASKIKVLRYSKDGVLDSGYGTNGEVEVVAPSGKALYISDTYLTAKSIAVSPDGRVSIGMAQGTDAAAVNFSTVNQRVVDISPSGAVRYSTETNFDTSAYSFEGTADLAHGSANVVFALDNPGNLVKIVNGVVDATWNGNKGKLNLASYANDAISADASDRVTYVTKVGTNVEVRRLKVDGTADTSFGTNGVTTMTLPATVGDVAIETDPSTGKFYVAATSTSGDFVYELSANGALNTSFGEGGTLQLSVTGQIRNGVRTAGDLHGLQYANNKLMIYAEGDGSSENGATSRVIDLIAEKPIDSYGQVVLTMNEGSRPIGLLTQRSLLSDIDLDGKNYDKVSLTVQRQIQANGDDIFGARGDLMITGEGRLVWKGEDIGSASLTSGRLDMVFNDKVTGEVLNDAMRAITYRNANPFQDRPIKLAWTMNDNDAVGAKTTTAVQTINIRNDNADVGDATLIGKVNGTTIDFQGYFTNGGKKYYYTYGTTRATLDDFFNAGEDTTDTARTAVLENGISVKLLTQAELETLWTQPGLPTDVSKSGMVSNAATFAWDVKVATATAGEASGSHMYYDLEAGRLGFAPIADSTSNYGAYAIFEVIDTPDPQPAFVDPAIKLVLDNGDSTTDRLTSDGRFEVVGLNASLGYQVSGDGGATWTNMSAGNMIFTLPEGRYEAGKVIVKQTDLSGFSETVTSTALYKIDKTIKSIGLLNDQGLSLTDSISADGSMVVGGIDAARPYEYSIDSGASWQTGGQLANGQFGFVLGTGTYVAGQLRVRQLDAEGAQSTARNTAAIQIDPVVGQGDITLVWDNGFDPKDAITSDERLSVSGLKVGLPFAFSTDGGTTWTTQPETATTKAQILVPEGSYGVNGVLVRQTDATGFTTQIGNQAVFSVDKTAKTIGLFNDQGLNTRDNFTADGRIVIKGLKTDLAYQYSTDGGATWHVGTKMGSDLVVNVAEDVYAAGKLQARQTDANGLTTLVKNDTTLSISTTKGQGAFSMAFDSGPSNSDKVTFYNKFYVSGLRDNLDWEYSLDSGATWAAGARVQGYFQGLNLPDGTFGKDAIQVRQTDASGFTTYVKNTDTYVVDQQIAQLSFVLVNDTGYFDDDRLTADGQLRIELTGPVGPDDSVQYSLDSGKTWTQGGLGSQTITLPNGTYSYASIRVKVSDTAGNTTMGVNGAEIVVDNTDTLAPVFTSASKVFKLDRDGTGTVHTTYGLYSLLDLQTTDANQVYYSLAGADAALFDVSEYGELYFREDRQQQNTFGDVYRLTAKATDAFGNFSTQDLEINITAPFYVGSKTVKNAWEEISQKTYEVNFRHKIDLISTGTIKLVSQTGSFADIVFDINDPLQVNVVDNKLILNIANLSRAGKYDLVLDNAIKSEATGEVWSMPWWESLGFTINKSVQYSSGVLNSTGSFQVTNIAEGANRIKGQTSVLGDVNGDGIDDWAFSVADGDTSAGGSKSGQIHVVFGRSDGVKPDFSTASSGAGGFLISGAIAGDEAGSTVASAGDVNGDGLQDIAIFSPNQNGGLGKGYIVYGQQTGGAINLTSVESNPALGRVYTNSVKDAFGAIGDVNGDGLDDLAHGRVDLERVTVLKTISKADKFQDVKGKIVEKADWLGFAFDWIEVAGKVADFFDDPLAATIENAGEWEDNLDLALGKQEGEDDDDMSPLAQAMKSMILQVKNQLASNQTLEGMSYAKSGGGGNLLTGPKDTVHELTFKIKTTVTTITTLTTTLFGAGETVVELGNVGTKKITGTINGQQVGTDVAALGDINGDGRADYGVLDTGSGGVLARMNVVYGTKSTDELFTNNFDSNIGGFRIMDPYRTTEYVGEGMMKGLGDFNGDGINDFALSLDAVHAATYVVFGRSGMTSVDLSQVASGNGGFKLADASRYGMYRVDSIGDFNGDGLDDFAYYLDSSSVAQSITVIYGGKGAPTDLFDEAKLATEGRGFKISAIGTKKFADNNAVSAGDINGDGLTDLVIRTDRGDSVVLMGSNASGRYAQVDVDQMGTSGDDTLTSTGVQLLVGGAGNDTLTTKGADVILAGAGDDRIVIDQGMATALANGFGFGGNTTHLAKIEGGGGMDTILFSGGISLDFRNVTNKLLDMDNISGRVSGIEKFDLATDTAANKITIGLNDVLEMGANNAFNTTKGWLNVSGTELSSLVAKAQLAMTTGSNDRVELRSSEWTATGAIVREQSTNEEYFVYQAKDAVAAQLLIDKDAVFGWV